MARAEAVNALLSGLTGRLDATVGGKARLRVVLLLGGVLSLQSADTGTVGALAPQLERAFHIGNTEVGLLITASSLVAAASSLPMGVLVDSTSRVRLLVVTVSLWSVCMAASGLATGYGVLLVTRLALGAVIAASGPAVASLTGDLFPAKERSRIYGMVLTGELLGAGAGFDTFGGRRRGSGVAGALFRPCRPQRRPRHCAAPVAAGAGTGRPELAEAGRRAYKAG